MTLTMVPSYATRHESLLSDSLDEPAWKMDGVVGKDPDGLPEFELSEEDVADFLNMVDLPLSEMDIDPDLGWCNNDLLSADTFGELMPGSNVPAMNRDEDSQDMESQYFDELFGDDALRSLQPNSFRSMLTPDFYEFGKVRPAMQVPESILADHAYSQTLWEDCSYDTPSGSQSMSGSLSRCSSTSDSLGGLEDKTISLLTKARDQAHSLLAHTPALAPASQSFHTTPSKSSRQATKQTTPKNSPSSRLKRWNTMNSEEQMESITELSNVISTHLGVRERLEAIRIINPDSDVSLSDGQFVLDMTTITNARYTKLQRFVRRHAEDYWQKPPSHHNATKHTQPPSFSHVTTGELTPCTQPKPSRKRKGRGGRQEKLNIVDSSKPKDRQQRVKEAKSGLFVREVRMHVHHTLDDGSGDDDGDLNILD